jgi:hypothetical protein
MREDFWFLTRLWRRGMSRATCDVAETKLKTKKTASSFPTTEWLQLFLNRSSWFFSRAFYDGDDACGEQRQVCACDDAF